MSSARPRLPAATRPSRCMTVRRSPLSASAASTTPSSRRTKGPSPPLGAQSGGATGAHSTSSISAALLLRVGQFAERIGEFEAADIKLEALAEPQVAGLWPRQGGERDGIVVKEGRRADAEMRLDAIEKNPKEQRLPIVARMRRDTYALRRRGEPRRIRASRIGRGGEEVDAAMALERV